MALEGEDFVKEKNVAIMKCLMVLLILSNLLIGLGLLALIPCSDMNLLTEYFDEWLFSILGVWMFFIVLTAIPYIILLLCWILFCVSMLITAKLVGGGSILSAVFAVKSFLKISQDNPDQQCEGKELAAWALRMNAIDAVLLMLLTLFLNFLSHGFLAPWSLYSLYLCLAGAAVLPIEFFTYRRLQIPVAEEAKVIPDA